MARLSAFAFLTLNGFYKAPGDDTSWHRHGEEEAQFSAESLQPGNTLLFGRKTYEMMANYWPSQAAADTYPEVAKGMNAAEKIVLSTSLKAATWTNTRIIRGDLVNQVKALKAKDSPDITILGSGSIVTQLADIGLIDSFHIMIDPVAIGDGSSLFKGLSNKLDLSLKETRVFKSSGVALLMYERLPR